MPIPARPSAQRVDRRRSILLAAYTVIQRDGFEALTLEAVAREAEISKGGLLYHFPNKEALVSGLVTQFVDDFDGSLAGHLSTEPEAPGRWLRAFVGAGFEEVPGDPDGNAGLLAAAGLNPTLLDPIRKRYAEWDALAAADGIDPTQAMIVRLVVDGLTFADLFGFAPPDPATRDRLREALLATTRGDRRPEGR